VSAGTTIAASVGCSSPTTAACLRGVSASALVNAAPPVLYPFVDGTILPQTPSAAFASGNFNQVPIISGGNHDEYRLFVAEEYDALGNPLTTLAQYQDATIALFGIPLGFGVLAVYPSDLPSPGVALGTSGTDGVFACPERNGVRLHSKYVTTYAYEFNDENAYLVFDFFPSPPYPPITFPLGAAHGTEVPYLFDILSIPSNFTPGQEHLSEAMISYWTQFAATGDPNSPAEPRWSPYSSATDEFQSLLPPTPAVETTFDSNHLCSDFWNTF
jgi:para-nitrobenzyl esterase